LVVTLYTRAGCHLCDDAEREIDTARRHADFTTEVIDIDTDPELHRQYNEEVPVVFVNGKKAFKYRLSAAELLKTLAGRA
jgi:glutaredoxin